MTTNEILTAILVVITGIYAYLTYRIAITMAKQTDILSRPYIAASVFLLPKIPIFYLRIKNTGRTAACNLRLRLDRDFFQYGEAERSNLAQLTAFKEPIASLGPDAELIFDLAQAHIIFGADANPSLTPKEFNINVAYDYEGGSVENRFHIDLNPYLGSSTPSSPLIDELEEIRKVLQKTS